MHTHIFILFLTILNFYSCSQEKETVRNDKPLEKQVASNEPSDYNIEVFAEGLEVPWSIVFTSGTRMLVAERPGRVRAVENGKVIETPLLTVADVVSNGEEGLMGLTLDPDYANNKYVYISYAYEADEMKVKVVRYTDNGSSLTAPQIIIDNLPAERYHAGCRLRFGPDNKLYVTTGDAGERDLAQETGNLYGKILRLNSDGTIPVDNPFPNNPVWSYGHRNAQGIDWYPGTDILYSTEHGPSGFDGGTGGDEVNVVVKGGNYGWPVVSHNESKSGMISPAIMYASAVAPASGMFYKSGVIPQFKNNFFFGCLRGQAIIRVVVDENDPSKVISHEKMAQEYGRIRDIAEGPDGAIYFSSSNLDGRGKPKAGDDKIYRIVKK